jgi:nitroreductase
MELYQAMRTTPASRQFTDDDLPDDVLYDILEHARFAPSGSNRQAWRVIAVRDPEKKRRIAELYDLGMREYAAFARHGRVPFPAADAVSADWGIDLAAAREVAVPQASGYIATVPVLLVILLDTTNCSAVDAGLGRVPLTAGASIFPFAHNILLAARGAGYGGHLTSVLARQEPALRQLLGIPGHYALGTMLPLGKPVRVITRLGRAHVEEFTTVDDFDGPPLSPPTAPS